METKMIYLDNAASTRVSAEAAAAAANAMLEVFGNTSSTHAAGRRAAELLEKSRLQVASALGSSPREIYFTSCGTEADNLALHSAVSSKNRAGNHIITSLSEHYGVLKYMQELERQGFEVTYLKPSVFGGISADAVASALREDTALVSIMLVNNETGAINHVGDYAAEIKRRGFKTLLHTDAVQGFGKLPLSVKSLGADMISVSAHKLHGAKGSGALYSRVRLSPMLFGGGQEGGFRSGTQALPAIAAFGVAAEAAAQSLGGNLLHVTELRDYCTSRMTELGVQVISAPDACPYILSISLPGHRSETLMNALDADGICVARSSACKKGARSHVLEAMGLPAAVIDGALRISFSRETVRGEIDAFAESLEKISKSLFRRR